MRTEFNTLNWNLLVFVCKLLSSNYGLLWGDSPAVKALKSDNLPGVQPEAGLQPEAETGGHAPSKRATGLGCCLQNPPPSSPRPLPTYHCIALICHLDRACDSLLPGLNLPVHQSENTSSKPDPIQLPDITSPPDTVAADPPALPRHLVFSTKSLLNN